MNVVEIIETWWEQHVNHTGKSSAAQLVSDLELAKPALMAAVAGPVVAAPPALMQVSVPVKENLNGADEA